jgi:hypothetical protein
LGRDALPQHTHRLDEIRRAVKRPPAGEAEDRSTAPARGDPGPLRGDAGHRERDAGIRRGSDRGGRSRWSGNERRPVLRGNPTGRRDASLWRGGRRSIEYRATARVSSVAGMEGRSFIESLAGTGRSASGNRIGIRAENRHKESQRGKSAAASSKADPTCFPSPSRYCRRPPLLKSRSSVPSLSD